WSADRRRSPRPRSAGSARFEAAVGLPRARPRAPPRLAGEPAVAGRLYQDATPTCRLREVRVSDPVSPTTAAISAALVSSSPDEREKLTARSPETPSPTSTAEVAPTPTTAPPAVIGRIAAAADRHRITSATVGENPTPSATSRRALPVARMSQQPSSNAPAMHVER